MGNILASITSTGILSTALNSLAVDSGYEKYVLIASAIIFAAIIVVVFGKGVCKSKDEDENK